MYDRQEGTMMLDSLEADAPRECGRHEKGQTVIVEASLNPIDTSSRRNIHHCL